MSVKHYGVFIAYPPTVDLRDQGLGRHLAAFLGAAGRRSDVRFVIVCPEWSREGLLQLCESEGVRQDGFDLVTTDRTPFVVRLVEVLRRFRRQTGHKDRLARLARSARALLDRHRRWLERMVVRSRHGLRLLPIGSYVLIVGAAAMPVLVIGGGLWALGRLGRMAAFRYKDHRIVAPVVKQAAEVLDRIYDYSPVFRLYRQMEESEAEMLVAIANGQRHVSAWYCPAAFWPYFNKIAAPRLMCVPDVVLSEFPAGFARLGGDRFLGTFNTVESAIRGGSNYVTYSDNVKWATLVDHYGCSADSVHVVRHAPNRLDAWITVEGFPDNKATSESYCRQLLRGALTRASNRDYAAGFSDGAFPFIFYASQIRPNKNVLSLLMAYRHLLQDRLISHKLLLTGDPSVQREVQDYVRDNRLENDVLFVRGLSVQQLAACYRLATLAVNPSFSEGGCPFTFSEALSVGTPVVMANIPVTREVLDDPALFEHTFFDPYDWRDMSACIEWGLQNRDALLEAQLPVYSRLAARTWDDVVDEHILVLERMSST